MGARLLATWLLGGCLRSLAKLALKASILRGLGRSGAKQPRNLRVSVGRILEKLRFGCNFEVENAAKPWFGRLGGSQTMYFTRVWRLENHDF